MLINSPDVSEHELQSFFERNPGFLQRDTYEAAYPHIVLQRDEPGTLIPDFALKPYNENAWEFVKKRYGLSFYKPRMIVLIGKRSDCMPHDLRKAEYEIPHLTIETYDDLLARVRSHKGPGWGIR